MLELPQKFKNDIQGKDTYLVPLVIIDERVYISTSKIVLDENYDPLLISIGNIKESVDPIEKTFKISSVNISLNNVLYNDITLGERLFSPSVMNKKLDIYYKSQSAQSLNDCLKVYSGYVSSIKENIDKIEISVEDRTELTFNKKLPLRSSPTTGIPEKFRNKPVPIVYGIMPKSPLIYSNEVVGVENDYASIGDDFFIKSIGTPKVFLDDVYLNIAQYPSLWNAKRHGTIYAGATRDQWIETQNSIVFLKESVVGHIDSSTGEITLETSPISHNFVEVYQQTPPYFKAGVSNTDWESAWLDYFTITQIKAIFGEDFGDEVNQGSETNPISLSTDLEGHNATKVVEGSYFTVQDFSNLPAFIWTQKSWLFGRNTATYFFPAHQILADAGVNPETGDSWVYQNYFTRLETGNVMNMEIEPFCNSNNVCTQLEYASGTGMKDIKQKTYLNYDITAKIKNLRNYNPTLWTYTKPKIHFVVGDRAKRTTRFGHLIPYDTEEATESNPLVINDDYGESFDTYEYFNESKTTGSNYKLDVQDISFSNFSISSYGHGGDGANASSDDYALYMYEGGTNAVEWLMFNYIKLTKNAILNDFMATDLFAHVEGRVDDVYGRYTGNSLTVLSGESNISVRQDVNELSAKQVSMPSQFRQKNKKMYANKIKPISKTTNGGKY